MKDEMSPLDGRKKCRWRRRNFHTDGIWKEHQRRTGKEKKRARRIFRMSLIVMVIKA
jgi:hypothetical protein